MTHRLWIFPAILCLLLTLTFYESFSFLGGLLLLGWLLRLLLLKQRAILKASIVVGLLFMGSLYFHQLSNGTQLNEEDTNFIVYPNVTSIQVDGDVVRFDGIVQKESMEEQVVVTYQLESEGEKERWLNHPPLHHLRIAGQLEVPAEQSNFNQFNYQVYLKRQHVHWLLDAEKIDLLTTAGVKKPKRAWIENIRHSIFQKIDQTFHAKTASYLKILLFADKRTFSEEVLQNYRAIGVVHLFSISGFHISYLVQLIRFLLLRLGITHERTHLLLLLILPLYGFLTGFGVSVFRAIGQNSLLLGNLFRKQPLDTIDAWAITMILALFMDPSQIYHISFQLSYLLSGIFILMGKQKWMRALSPVPYSLLFSLMSGLASLPILSYHFYEISWITTLANLFFIPFFSNVLFPIFLLLFFSAFLFSGSFVFSFLERSVLLLIQFVEQLLSLLTETFNFSFVIGRLPIVVLLLLVVGIVSVLKQLEKKQRPNWLSILFIAFSLFYYQISPVGYVLMLDIGQGDSILVKEPLAGRISLIDTGGSLQWGEREEWREREQPYSIGRDTIAPALKSLGISTIDRLYLTHADADHSGEIQALGETLTIKEIVATENTFEDEAVGKQSLSLQDTVLKVIAPPAVLNFPASKTIAIHPKANTFYKDNNNQSLVLYVTLGNDKWLFTGDIEEEAEAALIKGYPHLKVDRLKISHHGSQTSSTEAFIDQVQPKTALISVGENNSFGHPHPDVLERLKEHGVKVYSTDSDGAIMVRYLKIPFTKHWWSDTQTVHKN